MPYGSSVSMPLPGGTQIARRADNHSAPKWAQPQKAPIGFQTAVLALTVELTMAGLVPQALPGKSVTLFLRPSTFLRSWRQNVL